MSKKSDTPFKTLAVDVEPDLHKAVKQAAVDQGISLKDYVTPLLKIATGFGSAERLRQLTELKTIAKGKK